MSRSIGQAQVNVMLIGFKVSWYLLHRPGSRHCQLAIRYSTIRQRVLDC